RVRERCVGSRLADPSGRVTDLELDAALELDAVVEPAEGEAKHADQQQDGRCGVPALAAADEVDVRLAAIERPEDRHQLRPSSDWPRIRALRAAARSAALPSCGVVRR